MPVTRRGRAARGRHGPDAALQIDAPASARPATSPPTSTCLPAPSRRWLRGPRDAPAWRRASPPATSTRARSTQGGSDGSSKPPALGGGEYRRAFYCRSSRGRITSRGSRVVPRARARVRWQPITGARPLPAGSAAARSIAGTTMSSSGPSAAPVSATRIGWNRALPFCPVRSFTRLAAARNVSRSDSGAPPASSSASAMTTRVGPRLRQLAPEGLVSEDRGGAEIEHRAQAIRQLIETIDRCRGRRQHRLQPRPCAPDRARRRRCPRRAGRAGPRSPADRARMVFR